MTDHVQDMEDPLLRAHIHDHKEHGPPVQLEGEDDVSAERSTGSTVLQTCFNLINVFMGIGLLSCPYAMRLSGWAGLLALASATCLFCLSGKLIVAGFKKIPANMPQTYPALGQAAMGSFGRGLVVVLAMTEFFGASAMAIIVIWRTLAELFETGLFGLGPLHTGVLLTTITITPLLFIPTMRRLAMLSSMGFVSTVLVTLAVAAATVVDPHRKAIPQQPPPGHEVVRWGIIQATGIFAVSVSGHSCLPAVRNSMAEPQRFNSVLNLAFSTMALIYGTVASLGYFYFGNRTSELITADLAERSPFSGRSLLVTGLTLDRFVNVCIALNAWTTYPVLVVVLQDMALSVLQPPHSYRQPRRSVVTCTRLAVFALGTLVSYQAYNVLGIVMSLVGGFCSISCSLLMPSLFFAVLYWRDLRLVHRAGCIALLVFGLCLGTAIVARDLDALLHQLRTTGL